MFYLLQQQMQYPGLVSSSGIVTAATDGSGLIATTAGGQQLQHPTFSVGLDQLLQQNQFCK